MVESVLGDAADAVAAHLRLAAVGVEHPHPHVRRFRWKDQDQSISPNAKMPVRDFPGNARGIGHRLGEPVDVNVIVPDAVHLRELHDRDILAAHPKRRAAAAASPPPPRTVAPGVSAC